MSGDQTAISLNTTQGFPFLRAVHATIAVVTPVGEVAGVGDVRVHRRAVGLRDRRTCRAQTRHNSASISPKTKPLGKDVNN